MTSITFPSGYQQVMPYLILNDADGFITYMKDVFNAEEKLRHMRDEHIIMHAEITLGESVIMLADATGDYEPRTGGFFIYVTDADATYTKAINAGAKAISPIADMPYGRSGGVVDPFGNTWWITTHLGE